MINQLKLEQIIILKIKKFHNNIIILVNSNKLWQSKKVNLKSILFNQQQIILKDKLLVMKKLGMHILNKKNLLINMLINFLINKNIQIERWTSIDNMIRIPI